MRKKWLKKGSAVLLAAAMALSLFPGMNGTLLAEQATENVAPTTEYWTDAEGLKAFTLTSLDTRIGKIKFGVDGQNAREWAICGVDTDGSLALLSTSEFAKENYGSNSAYSTSNFVKKIEMYLNKNYFSTGEIGKMVDVTVTTNEPDGNEGNWPVPVADKKLYLPNSFDQYYCARKKIYVGSNNNIEIDVMKVNYDNGFEMFNFWLRSPDNTFSDHALVVTTNCKVNSELVSDGGVSVVPALNLNLSSVLFASAAEAAASSYSGYKANSRMTENTYTLRYTSEGAEAAVISVDGTKVTVTNANNKYLMVQNSTGVYAMPITSGNQIVNASDIQMGSEETDKLGNFNNCKVWIESTDEDRITTAKLATTAINSVAVTYITTPEAGSALDTDAACVTTGVTSTTPTVTWKQGGETATGNAGYNTTYTASVTLTVAEGYEFTADTTATIDDKEATVVYNSDKGTLTITYTFSKTSAKAVTDACFATIDDLKECYNISDGTIGKIRFGLKEWAAREWAICGVDDINSSLALLSTSAFATAAYGSTSEYSKSNFVADISKYVDVNNNGSTYLEINYFSIGETEKMAEVTVMTNEPTTGNSVPVKNKKLYLPNSQNQDYRGESTIYVGSNNDIEIDVRKLNDDNGFQPNPFWLRSPFDINSSYALVAHPDGIVFDYSVNNCGVSVVPALNLNLSSVLFASAAKAASSSDISAVDMPAANIFTLRYAPEADSDLAKAGAEVSYDGSKVTVTGGKAGMYLMVQKGDKAYSVPLTEATTSIAASGITGADLTSFDDCKVWIESTDDNRITTAVMAAKAEPVSIEELKSSISTVEANLSDNQYSHANYTTASIAKLRTALIEAKNITVSSTPNEVTGAYNALLTASAIGADGLIVATKHITVALGNEGVLRGTYRGTGWYAAGDQVTLSAAAAMGYQFKGWTTSGTYVEDSAITTSSHEITIGTDTPETYYLWFEEVGYTVSINTPTEGGSASADKTSYVYGETAKVTATPADQYEFAGWTDEHGITVSTESEYSFTVLGSYTLTPNFIKTVNEIGGAVSYVTVNFYHQTGKLLSSQKLIQSEGTVTEPLAPTKGGYTFAGWSADKNGTEPIADINTATFAADTNLYPVFTKQEIMYTLTVDGKSYGEGSYAPQTRVTVTAEAPIPGETFFGWMNGKDEYVSYDAEYSFIIAGDTTLKSVYIKESEQVQKKAAITMDAPIYDTEESGYYGMTFYFNYYLPEGCTLVDIGTLRLQNQDLSADGITFDTENILKRSLLDSLGAAGQFYYTKLNYYETGHTVCGYMVYTDANGNRQTIYSNSIYGILQNREGESI